MLPVVLGLNGTELTEREASFIREFQPFAFLLFARNISTIEQTRALVANLKELCPHALVGVDQEGGRVQRLTFHGRYPAAKYYGTWYEADASTALEVVRLQGFLLAADVAEVGANWVYGPVLDRLLPTTHDMIASRAFSNKPEVVVQLARAFLAGLKEAGCHGCLKHAPGQGRAVTDSHVDLPMVEATLAELEEDFLSFKELAPEVPFIMTSHTAFTAFGHLPTTLNSVMLDKIRNDWKAGLIVADDLGMHALKGDYAERFRAAIKAGCDVGICSFSRLKAGMAGTVYAQDEAELFFAAAASLPEASVRVRNTLAALPVLTVPADEMVLKYRQKFEALWADVPQEVGYTWPV